MQYRTAKLVRKMLGKGGVTPVAALERRDKAAMIYRILADFRGGRIEGLRVLDIGSGNGDIAHYFAGRGNEVVGIDSVDRRRADSDAYQFIKVESEEIPLLAGAMDIILSNQVIEHVDDQRLHLSEIKRVLARGGCVYMATPNDRSPLMRGHVGNSQVLGYPEMKALFVQGGFDVHEYSGAIVRDPDSYDAPRTLFRRLPSAVVGRLANWFPSHVFVLTHDERE